MHPVRRALNSYKSAHPNSTDSDFARYVGYTNVDAIYKQMRGEYVAPPEKLERMASLVDWSPGRFLDECLKHARRKAS